MPRLRNPNNKKVMHSVRLHPALWAELVEVCDSLGVTTTAATEAALASWLRSVSPGDMPRLRNPSAKRVLHSVRLPHCIAPSQPGRTGSCMRWHGGDNDVGNGGSTSIMAAIGEAQ